MQIYLYTTKKLLAKDNYMNKKFKLLETVRVYPEELRIHDTIPGPKVFKFDIKNSGIPESIL